MNYKNKILGLKQEIISRYMSSAEDEGNIDGDIDCHQFAYMLKDKFSKLREKDSSVPHVKVWTIETSDTNNYHTFAEIDGKYYDFDDPEGVDDWMKLKFIKKYGLPDDWEFTV